METDKNISNKTQLIVSENLQLKFLRQNTKKIVDLVYEKSSLLLYSRQVLRAFGF